MARRIPHLADGHQGQLTTYQFQVRL
jgi:hypothetical protein